MLFILNYNIIIIVCICQDYIIDKWNAIEKARILVFIGTLCNERAKCGNIATMIIHENARKLIKIMKIHQIRNSRRFREIFRISNVIRKPLYEILPHN